MGLFLFKPPQRVISQNGFSGSAHDCILSYSGIQDSGVLFRTSLGSIVKDPSQSPTNSPKILCYVYCHRVALFVFTFYMLICLGLDTCHSVDKAAKPKLASHDLELLILLPTSLYLVTAEITGIGYHNRVLQYWLKGNSTP